MKYFDNASTTKVSPEVLKAMEPYLTDLYGNSTSKYYKLAEDSNKAIIESNEIIKRSFNCPNAKIVYTGSCTEANNTIIKGIFGYKDLNKKFAITSLIEHSSVIEPYKFLENLGLNVTYISPTSDGEIKADNLESFITKETKLVSIMYVNNETGVINNIEEIDNICTKYGVILHCDVTQAVGKINIDLSKYRSLKFITYSAHKIKGPKGVGCLICLPDNDGIHYKIEPLLHGGNQQAGYRSSTIDVASIVGLAKATEISTKDIYSNLESIKKQSLEMRVYIEKEFGETNFISFDNQVDGIYVLKLCKGINNIFLKKNADKLAASTGSACSITKPSHVYKAMGYSEEEIRKIIRISLTY